MTRRRRRPTKFQMSATERLVHGRTCISLVARSHKTHQFTGPRSWASWAVFGKLGKGIELPERVKNLSGKTTNKVAWAAGNRNAADP